MQPFRIAGVGGREIDGEVAIILSNNSQVFGEVSLTQLRKGLITLKGCSHGLKGLNSRPLRQTIGPSKRSQEKFGGPFYFPIKGRCRGYAQERAFLSPFPVKTQLPLPHLTP